MVLVSGRVYDIVPPEADLIFACARSRVYVSLLFPATYPSVDGGDTSARLLGYRACGLPADPHPHHPGALGRVGRSVRLSSLHGRPGVEETGISFINTAGSVQTVYKYFFCSESPKVCLVN